MRRVFIAINLPEKVKSTLEGEKIDFPEKNIVKWVKKENLHITLSFLGEIKDEEILRVCEVMEKIKKQSFSLKAKKISYFGDKIPPKLIIVSLKENKELNSLVEEIKEGIEIKDKPFIPHITLGRVKSFLWRRMEPEERPIIEKEISFEFKVNSIEVMESSLSRKGSSYTILQSIKL